MDKVKAEAKAEMLDTCRIEIEEKEGMERRHLP